MDGWKEDRLDGCTKKRNFIADENGRGLENKNNVRRLNSQERPFARCPDASAAPCWLRAPLYGRRRWNFSNLCGSSRPRESAAWGDIFWKFKNRPGSKLNFSTSIQQSPEANPLPPPPQFVDSVLRCGRLGEKKLVYTFNHGLWLMIFCKKKYEKCSW